MTDNIVKFPGVEVDLDVLAEISDENYGPQISVDDVIEAIREKGLSDILVIGTYDNSDNMYFASTSGNLAKLNWDLDRAKIVLMDHSFMMNDGFLDE